MLKDSSRQQEYINDIIYRCKFFQDTQVWPLRNELDYNGWLGNFHKTEEKYLAAVILSFYIYYSKALILKLCADTLSCVCSLIRSQNSYSAHHDFFTFYYTFPTGKEKPFTKSGAVFMRMLTNKFGVSNDKIMDLKSISDKVLSSTIPLNIVILDDFIGSGKQCCDSFSSSLFSLAIKRNPIHNIILAPLICNKIGYDNIREAYPNIMIATAHLLGEEYNLFSKSCICWRGDDELYNAGTSLILEKSEELGIPSDGRREIDAKGYAEQGLAISFSHGTPDAVPGIFYFDKNGWNNLVSRPYTID